MTFLYILTSLPDAIKEFNLSITEQTDAAKAALTNAFGEKFTSNLLKGVKNGSITAKEALATISAEAKRIGLNSQQAQLLTADLFKGAGEDAGGALKIVEAVNIALNEQEKPLTEIQQIQKEQLDTSKELNSTYTQLFASGSKGFNVWIQKGKLFATQTLLQLLKGGIDVYNWFVELNNESGLFSAWLTALGQMAVTPFKVLGKLISGTWKSFKSLGNIVASLFTFDSDKIKQSVSQHLDTLNKTIKEVAKVGVDAVSKIYDAFNDKSKLKKVSLKDFLSDDTGSVTTPSKNNNETSNQSEEESSEKVRKELAKKKELIQKSEEELDALIKKIEEERKLKQKKGVERELQGIDNKYAKLKEKFVLSKVEESLLSEEELVNHHNKIKELEAAQDLERKELKIVRDAEFKERVKTIEEENRIEEKAQELERNALAAETEEERVLILLNKVKWIADEEIRIEEEKALKKLKIAGASETEITAVKKKFALQKAKVEATFQKEEAQANEEASQKERVILHNRIQAYSNMFGNIAQLLGQHTAAGKSGCSSSSNN